MNKSKAAYVECLADALIAARHISAMVSDDPEAAKNEHFFLLSQSIISMLDNADQDVLAQARKLLFSFNEE